MQISKVTFSAFHPPANDFFDLWDSAYDKAFESLIQCFEMFAREHHINEVTTLKVKEILERKYLEKKGILTLNRYLSEINSDIQQIYNNTVSTVINPMGVGPSKKGGLIFIQHTKTKHYARRSRKSGEARNVRQVKF